ncbi:MAG: CoB--CoM heterodisulfide reductase iron-sulfur subunit A family protein [Candidatus Thorarchaeota archaeon]|nr:MAG: CoB--CoM heterodisulfide reductase iron-sulfur subunit A family protein [Candidatus Thorarchaeota archaeon]
MASTSAKKAEPASKPTDVLVIGAGMAGINAALSLAEGGHHAHVIEKTVSIGGNYVAVYKIFPMLECSACVMTPLTSYVGKHPNITVYALSTVEKVTGTQGNFTVTVRKKARYVNEDTCTGCQQCIRNCPVEVPSEFDHGLSLRKAIYMNFPQQVPLVATIDRESCIGCGTCAAVCPQDCIDYDDEDTLVDLNVGSIVVATGFQEYKPVDYGEYGYGIYPNVVTSLEYDRMTHPTGPTDAHMIRPSDGKEPEKILFVNCVGSRDIRENIGGYSDHCNRVCCSFGLKLAQVTRMHYPEDHCEIIYTYMDMRTAGKSLEEFLWDSERNHGIDFIRGRVSEVGEDPDTRDLFVKMEDTEKGEIIEIDKISMVVLNASFRPNEGQEELAKTLKIEIDENGWVKTAHPNSGALETTRKGIYVAGCANGPKDGTDTVNEGKGAGMAAHSKLPIPTPSLPEPIPPAEVGDEARVGVFICHCGGIIGNVIDSPGLAEWANGLPNVVYSTDYLFMCSDPGQEMITEAIKEHKLNRVVVGSCSPLQHQETFRRALEAAGLSPYYFIGPVCLREHLTLVNANAPPDERQEKAQDMMRSAVAKAINAEVIPVEELEVTRVSMVVGGGVSGMTASLDLATKGFDVILVEKQDRLGGRLNELHHLFPRMESAKDIVEDLVAKVEKEKRIKVFLKSKVVGRDGSYGNYDIEIENIESGGRDVYRIGTMVVTVGTDIYEPKPGEYGYGEIPAVISTLELERKLRKGELKKAPKNPVFIHCVGSRQNPGEGNRHCSRVCCSAIVTMQHELKEMFPDIKVYSAYKEHIRPYANGMEEMWRENRQNGVAYLRWVRDRQVTVEKDPDGDDAIVTVYDTLAQETFKIKSDLVVLALGLESPSDSDELAKALGINRGADGFFAEMHMKYRPVETTVPGVFLGVTYAKNVADSVNQARGAASEAAVPLNLGTVEIELETADVDQDLCVGCDLCHYSEICPYDAVSMIEVEPGVKKSVTDEMKCEGCGACTAICPTGARDLRWWREHSFLEQIEEMLKE